MRIAAPLAILVFSCCATALAQTSQPSAISPSLRTASLSTQETTLTGCLEGKTNGYYLIEQNGTVHMLMGRNRDLRLYVDRWVELGGNRDNSRDASASSDQGTAHGLRFFQVEEVIADNGTCKR